MSAEHSDSGRALATVALLGAGDVASFIVTRRKVLFGDAPGRARGSLLGLVLWGALVGVSLGRLRSPSSGGLRLAARVLAVTCGIGNLALAGVHLKVRRGQGRAVFGAAVGVAAILSAPRG